MAIHTDHPGLEVCVLVVGQPLPEHEDESAASDTKTTTKYVEARAGCEFTIGYKFLHPFPITQDVRVSFSLDGTIVEKICYFKGDLRSRSFRVMEGIKTRHDKQWFEQAFHFGDLNIVEADERSSDQIDPTTIAALGCIEITFHTGRKTNLQKRKTKPYDWFVRESVSEEALKGKAQSADPQKMTKANKRCRFEHDDAEPFASFVFKYRSHQHLQALGILPRDTSPSPPIEDKCNFGSTTPKLAATQVDGQDRSTDEALQGRVRSASLSRPSSSPAPPAQNRTPRTTPVSHVPRAPTSSAPRASEPRDPASIPSSVAPPTIKQENGATRSAPRPAAPTPTAGTSPLPQRTPAPQDPVPSHDLGLEKGKLIAMIAGYRGHERGLADKSIKSLLSLLKYYENNETEPITAAQAEIRVRAGSDGVMEGTADNGVRGEGVRVKRERDDENENGGGKRRRTESKKERVVIVLDG